MGWWERQVVPRVTDVLLATGQVHELRARVCEGLAGDLLEIGFGSGLNVEHYPAAVERVLAVEPSDVAWQIATTKHRTDGRPPVVRAGLDGEALDLPDGSVDCALSTFSLCTIPDLAEALAEVARVLRPGGGFHFLEHGLAPEEPVARWQHRLTPLQRRIGAGCHLDRPIADAVRASGLVVENLQTFYIPAPVSAMKVLGYLYVGRAVRT